MFGPTEVITIIGKRGHGKTTLSHKIQSIYPAVVVFDRLQEYRKEGKRADKFDAGYPAFDRCVHGFDEFANAIREVGMNPKFRILFQFNIEGGAHDEEFNEAMRVLYHLGGICIVIEEVWNFANKNYLPKWMRETLLTGRHGQNKVRNQGIAVVTTSQRPAEIHKTILSQSSQVFCGMLFEPNDLNYLKDIMGASVVSQLSSVPPYHFLQFRPPHPTALVSNR